MTIPTIAERIELHGREYATRFERTSVKRLARLLSHIELKPHCSVLDMGCGNAMLLEHIHGKVRRYVGVDFSAAFIEAAIHRAAKLRCHDVDFHCGAITEFCARHADQFDTCFALDLSEHVPDGEWAEILAAVFTCLKPGGAVHIHTPNLEFFIEQMKDSNFILKQFPEHIAVRSPEENLKFIRSAGFSEVSIQYLSHYNILRCVHPLSWLPVIGRCFRARLLITAVKPG